ncbi:hypothetical protein RRF57_009708 [Xylaria bambusicola]|uniref:Uncharacterized protein n=1 Tax=Xylaria bambusicola TaxID=326684 RepID=A0AAN7V2W9_9PEZI
MSCYCLDLLAFAVDHSHWMDGQAKAAALCPPSKYLITKIRLNDAIAFVCPTESAGMPLRTYKRQAKRPLLQRGGTDSIL